MAFNIAIRSPQRSLGASGALFAVAGYYTMTHPDSRVLLFFVFEMPAMVVRRAGGGGGGAGGGE